MSATLSDRMVLSGLWIAAGYACAAARKSAAGVGDESFDDRATPLRRVRPSVRIDRRIAWARPAAANAPGLVYSRVVRCNCLIRNCQKPSAAPV